MQETERERCWIQELPVWTPIERALFPRIDAQVDFWAARFPRRAPVVRTWCESILRNELVNDRGHSEIFLDET